MKNKKKFIASILTALCLLNFGCAKDQPQKVNAVTRTGQDLTTLAAQAFQTYTDAKDGDTSYLWSIYKGLTTLGPTFVKTKEDMKEVVKQWGDSKVDVATGKNKSLIQRLSELFNASDASPEAKTAAIAQAAGNVAAK